MEGLTLPSDARSIGWKQTLLRSELAVLEFTAFAEESRSSCTTDVGEFFALADEQDQRGPRGDQELTQMFTHCSPVLKEGRGG